MPDSWRLKVQRAEHHMKDAQREIRAYTRRHPYELLEIVHPRGKQNGWGYRIRMTEQPHDGLAIILGDFFHCLRSALDHMIFACKPASDRTQSQFPVETIDPWARDAQRRFLIRDPEVRKRFVRAIRGLAPEAQAFIKMQQPYTHGDTRTNILGVISRLDNADKHRRLIATGSGVRDPVITRNFPDGSGTSDGMLQGRSYFQDGAEVFHVRNATDWLMGHSKVDVHCRATAVITIQIPGDGRPQTEGHYRLEELLPLSVGATNAILRQLEPYVRR